MKYTVEEKYLIDPQQVKAGDLIAVTHYLRVVKAERLPVSHERRIVGDDLYNKTLQINVDGNKLIETAASADQFSKTEVLTQTQIAEKLVGSGSAPLTVVFEKTDKTMRTLRGRLIRPESLLGRSMVEDLDIRDNSNRLRLVDHRTLKSLILNGVKYETK